MDEFELIQGYFTDIGALPLCPDLARSLRLGIGDDCAVLRLPPSYDLCFSMDTLVAGVHFPQDAPAQRLGYRALAVNLSDLAAMGAMPLCFTLALTLPAFDAHWLASFAAGLDGCARRFGIKLVGGDTTRGPLSITIEVKGAIPEGRGLRRTGAQPGDKICVTGTLGDAHAALKWLDGSIAGTQEANPQKMACDHLIERYYEPVPRVREGQLLREYASACIDVSDGLLADLGHILKASGVGAIIRDESIPLSDAIRCLESDPLPLALTGGDDYELCFTITPSKLDMLRQAVPELGVAVIGTIIREQGMVRVDAQGNHHRVTGRLGYKHFE